MKHMPIPPGGYKPPSGRITPADHAGPGDTKDPQTGRFRAKAAAAPSAPKKTTGSAALHGRPSAVEKGPAKGPSGGKKK